ncbi:MAG: sodium-dependent transporter [Treponema sp.]|jgi:NSS family neurotransmitter:Na+ symporter|nr:sodium-dependent transporter [Treponema sp.]
MSEIKSRDSWTGKWGFILACVGSAVGMGNIWLFPYRVGQFGGAAFIIAYIICVILIGFTGIVEEVSFGRAAGSGPIGAFGFACEKRGRRKLGEALGLIPTIASLGIAIGYSVVVGWILRYLIGAITGSALASENSGAYFGSLATHFGSIPWQLVGLAITFAVMAAGISTGIEKMNKVMMPIFYVLFIILAIRAIFLPGSIEGYKYLFVPRWEFLADPRTWVFALGQAFFSLSLGGSGTLVYGSYLSKKENVVSTARYTAIFDSIAAMLAALVVIPSVYALLGADAVGAGPPLMFITMVEVFKNMPVGRLFMIIFFLAVMFAALTSLVNLFESAVEALQNKLKFPRAKAVITIAVIAVAVGVCIEGIVGEWMDVVSIYANPLGAIIAAFLFFLVLGAAFAKEQIELGREKAVGGWVKPMGILFCVITVLVYILGIFFGGIG